MEKPKPADYGYDDKYGWPDKDKRQAYRHAMSEYQKYLYKNLIAPKGKVI